MGDGTTAMSMAKRKNKLDREKAEKAALRRRLEDLAYGAMGHYNTPDWNNEGEFVVLANEMGIDAWAMWLGAISRALLPDDKAFLIELKYLENFEYLSKATDWLYEHGIRG